MTQIRDCRRVFSGTPNFCLSYSVAGKEFHAHCEVSVWKLSTLKELYGELARLLLLAKELGFSEVWSVTPNPKFCLLFGGIDTGVNIDGDRVIYWNTEEI